MTAILTRIVVPALLLVGSGGVLAQPSPASDTERAVRQLGRGFTSGTADVNGARLHYVRGGTGPAVILLHGFPQDWYAFHRIMPRLARRFTVVAVDMRGVGRSTVQSGGHDVETLAADIHGLAVQLQLTTPYVAGHDNGGMLAYAFMRLYPKAARGAMILDSPLPGIEPWPDIKADPALWHFGFHQTPDLPEQLLKDRRFVYFREFINRLALNRTAIADTEVTHYANAYGRLDQLRAGLAFYRLAYPQSETFNAGARDSIDVPLVLAGGDHSMGMLNSRIADALRRQHGCANVIVENISNSGHWVVDEQPTIVAELLERHASR